jgi:hypothetical protein
LMMVGVGVGVFEFPNERDFFKLKNVGG